MNCWWWAAAWYSKPIAPSLWGNDGMEDRIAVGFWIGLALGYDPFSKESIIVFFQTSRLLVWWWNRPSFKMIPSWLKIHSNSRFQDFDGISLVFSGDFSGFLMGLMMEPSKLFHLLTKMVGLNRHATWRCKSRGNYAGKTAGHLAATVQTSNP